MSTSNVDAHNATPLPEHVDGLLSPFTTRQYSHLPTPQSPNTLGRYINEQPPSPETPVPHNTSSSITPTASDKQRHESWKSGFGDKATRLESITSQYATPESSPHFQPQHSDPAAPRYPFHAIGFSTPKQTLSLPLEMDTPLRARSPLGSPSSHSPTLSSPFIGRISLDGSTIEQRGLPLAAAELDDVFLVPKLYHPKAAVKNTLSTPPVSPARDTGSTSVVLQAGGEMERIRQSVVEDTRNRIQDVESRRPDYLKRAKRTLPEADPSYFTENDREHWPPIGVMDSPQKGRRLKLFQETSDESFEESLMAGGYGRYRTTDWVRQPQPISLRSTVGSSSVVVSLLEKAEEAPTTEKELKKQKRLSAFRSVLQSGSSKVCPVELEGKGRVLMEVASPESAIPRSPEPSPSKRKGTNRRKKPGGSSPDKKTRHASSHEAQVEKPNWPDTEFPWRLRTEERNEEAKAVQEERLRWIERYLERDSDEDDDQVTSHIGQHDSAIVYDQDSRTSYQVKMGRGKMIPLSVAPDDPWNLIPKRTFPLDPADAREALLSKKSVRTLSYRQQKRKRQEDDDEDEDEVLCICRGEDDGRQLVQCDSCQMWYHLECIGIKSIAALGREEDPWFCGNCQARSRSPSTEIDDTPSSEPTFVPTDPLPTSRRSSDATFFQPTAPESPNWSSARMPRTPTRSIRNSLEPFRPPWNWTDPSRPMPSTPRQHHAAKVYNTPGPLDNSNPFDDSPFDPASTPSRGIKFHVPFATPKATAWRPNPMLQTPSRNRGGTNKYHVPHSASLDDNMSVGSAIQCSFARVLPSDELESPIRRNRSSDATFGRRRFLSPVRPMP